MPGALALRRGRARLSIVVARRRAIERVADRRTTCATTRWKQVFNEATLAAGARRPLATATSSPTLWRFARALEAARRGGERRAGGSAPNTAFTSRTTACASCSGCRGTPIDKIVSELMIHVNSAWGRELAAERHWRRSTACRTAARCSMSTVPAGHEGLGVDELRLGELAAAALRRSRQPAPADRARAGRDAAVPGERRGAAGGDARFRVGLRGLRRVPAPDGALLVPALARSRRTSSTATATVIRESLVRFDELPLVAARALAAGARSGQPGRARRYRASTCWNSRCTANSAGELAPADARRPERQASSAWHPRAYPRL